jgi:hypothetical protein
MGKPSLRFTYLICKTELIYKVVVNNYVEKLKLAHTNSLKNNTYSFFFPFVIKVISGVMIVE